MNFGLLSTHSDVSHLKHLVGHIALLIEGYPPSSRGSLDEECSKFFFLFGAFADTCGM